MEKEKSLLGDIIHSHAGTAIDSCCYVVLMGLNVLLCGVCKRKENE